MHTLASELNDNIARENAHVFRMLSDLGRELYFPKGILTQTAEAKTKATRYDATIGIAREGKHAMHLGSVMKHFAVLTPDEALPYAPTPGLNALREKWKASLVAKNPALASKRISQPVVTCGVTHGLSLAADLFVDKEDAMLLPDKLWDNYNLIFGVRRGANVVRYPFFSPDLTGFNVEAMRRAVAKTEGAGKLALVLTFPNNPTGYSVTEAEAGAIRDVLVDAAGRGCNIVVMCDEAYFGLFYGADAMKESLFSRLVDCHERILAVKLDGASKEDYVWGLRLGFITFGVKSGTASLYEALEKKAAGSIRGTISNCPHHSQSILLKAMADSAYGEQRMEKFEVLRGRFEKVRVTLTDSRFSKVWTPYPFNSGYFMCIGLKDLDAEKFRVRLLNDFGIGVIADGEKDIRIAFSCVEESDIPDLFEQMFQCAERMSNER